LFHKLTIDKLPSVYWLMM